MRVDQLENPSWSTKVKIKCQCGSIVEVLYGTYKTRLRKSGVYKCFKCSVRKGFKLTDQQKLNLSKSIKSTFTEERKAAVSKQSKLLWSNSEFRQKVGSKLKNLWLDPVIKAKAVAKIAPKTSKRMKEMWKDPQYRAYIISFIKPISKLQEILYSYLDDCNVKYEKEYKIDYWSFDCCVDRGNNLKKLLIEVQGDYFHTLPEQVVRDRQKSTYISNYYKDQYELKTIWEHEFKTHQLLKDQISKWLIHNHDSIDFSISDIQFKRIELHQANIFCGKYHYSANAGRSGYCYGAFLGDKLVAIAVFAVPIRMNIVLNGFKYSQTKELTRFCIADQYHKKNMASRCLSQFIKLFKRDNKDVKLLISFADETYGHVGTIYRATNWEHVGIVPPDYHYINSDGRIMHKKTLWDHASKMNMKESEFASLHGFSKVYGLQKHKYVMRL